MKQQKRKGFTLVELLIVIAILAILATVSIVGYTSFINKAQIANDTALLKQINDLLIADETVNGGQKRPTMQDALNVVEENGFVVEKFTPTAQGYNYVWNCQTNRFLLLNENCEVVAPVGEELDKANSYVIVHNEQDIANWEGYCFYLAKDFKLDSGKTELTVSTGVDAGMSENIDIVYNNTGSAQSVTIRTNGGNLAVNAPNDSVNHYGTAGKVIIEAIEQESYHEYGNVILAYIKAGHFATEEDGYVSILYVNPTVEDTKVKLTLKPDSVGTLYYKKGSLADGSVIPDSIKQELYTSDVSADSLQVISGGKVVASLSEAVAAGGSVELIDDVAIANTSSSDSSPSLEIADGANLSLNGNAITIESANGKNGITLASGATAATISDGEISQNKSLGSSYAVIKANEGTITLDNMTVKLTTSEGNGTCVSAGSDGGTLIIKNTTIDAPESGTIAVFCGSGSNVVIENSTIIGQIKIVNNGTLEIRGGDYTQATFALDSNNAVVIYSGVFAKDPRTTDLDTYGSTKNKVKIAEGSTVIDNGNGTWTVKAGNSN